MALPSSRASWVKFTRHSMLRALRPHDRGLARKAMRAGGFGLFHQRRDRPPGLAGPVRIDAVEAEHHRGIQHAAGVIADLERRARPGREIAVAGAIDEDFCAHRLAPGLRFDHQHVDALVILHHHAGAERVEEDIDLVGSQQIIGRDLVGRGVIGLRQDLAEHQMRRVQTRRAGRSVSSRSEATPCTTRCISP